MWDRSGVRGDSEEPAGRHLLARCRVRVKLGNRGGGVASAIVRQCVPPYGCPPAGSKKHFQTTARLCDIDDREFAAGRQSVSLTELF